MVSHKKVFTVVISLSYALIFIFLFLPKPVYAEGTGTLEICPWYSSNIEAENGDEFSVTFQSEETGESTTAVIDASAEDPVRRYEVTAGVYAITSIVYQGSNQAIIEEGYGIERSVYVPEGGAGIFHIYIGEAQVSVLDIDYGSRAFIVDSEHDQEGNRTVFHDNNGTYTYETNAEGDTVIVYLEEAEPGADSEGTTSETDDESGDSQESDEYVSDGIPTQNPANQGEVVIEYYDVQKQEEEDANSGTETILVVVLFLGLVAGGALFYLRKKGIL